MAVLFYDTYTLAQITRCEIHAVAIPAKYEMCLHIIVVIPPLGAANSITGLWTNNKEELHCESNKTGPLLFLQ